MALLNSHQVTLDRVSMLRLHRERNINDYGLLGGKSIGHIYQLMCYASAYFGREEELKAFN